MHEYWSTLTSGIGLIPFLGIPISDSSSSSSHGSLKGTCHCVNKTGAMSNKNFKCPDQSKYQIGECCHDNRAAFRMRSWRGRSSHSMNLNNRQIALLSFLLSLFTFTGIILILRVRASISASSAPAKPLGAMRLCKALHQGEVFAHENKCVDGAQPQNGKIYRDNPTDTPTDTSTEISTPTPTDSPTDQTPTEYLTTPTESPTDLIPTDESLSTPTDSVTDEISTETFTVNPVVLHQSSTMVTISPTSTPTYSFHYAGCSRDEFEHAHCDRCHSHHDRRHPCRHHHGHHHGHHHHRHHRD